MVTVIWLRKHTNTQHILKVLCLLSYSICWRWEQQHHWPAPQPTASCETPSAKPRKRHSERQTHSQYQSYHSLLINMLLRFHISTQIPSPSAENTSETPCFTVLCLEAELSCQPLRPIRERLVKSEQETRWQRPIGAADSWQQRKLPSDCHWASKGKRKIFL